MASAFLGKSAFISAVDLIQLKKLDFQNFYKSKLMEAKFDSLLFYWNNDGTVATWFYVVIQCNLNLLLMYALYVLFKEHSSLIQIIVL